MATFSKYGENLVSSTLTSGWVYYQDLYDTQRPFAEIVAHRLGNMVTIPDKHNYDNMEDSIMRLRTMSKNEFNNEKLFLKQVFGIDISFDYLNKNTIRDFVKTLNSCISTEDIYHRLITRISTGEDAKIDISEFFLSYFSSELTQAAKNTIAKCGDMLNTQLIVDIFEKELEKATERAISKMFNSKAFDGRRKFVKDSNYDNSKQEYQFLLQAIGKVKDSGSFANQVYQLYNLDRVKQALLDEIKKNVNLNIETLKKTAKVVVEKNADQKKGGLKEYLTQLIHTEVGKAKGVQVQSYNTGSRLMKPDVVTFYGIDGLNMIDKITNEHFVNRAENMQKLKEGYENLSKNFNGESAFIVYTNSKNYTLPKKDRSFGGFNAGGSGSFETMQKVLSRTQDPKAVATFINAIKQLATGAIGENMDGLRFTAEAELATEIAYFLFDDYEVIGSVQETSIKQLHVIDLDGLYLPMSFFLKLLADAYYKAINEIESDPKRIVSVSIGEKNKIKFPERPADGWKPEHWEMQRQEANSWELASIHFLKDFESIVMEYLHY